MVLPAPHPSAPDTWSLVGDGAATLCAVLLAAANRPGAVFERGHKRRVSVRDSRRERWTAASEVFAATRLHVTEALEAEGFAVEQRHVEGEPDLLLMHGTSKHGVVSFGVRNSGTQAKTSLSMRLSRALDPRPFWAIQARVEDDLVNALTAP